eukprot:TRINITY_DN10917_c0_g1_i1.p1 TRINITY_DN10917_c0_g1~~TRINITY_DN10917_c0_g1_i1.p1  ORF type:complete len:158 (+),score=31.78 TRINITY_DN10917_c0_g1_i1:71-544(+)
MVFGSSTEVPRRPSAATLRTTPTTARPPSSETTSVPRPLSSSAPRAVRPASSEARPPSGTSNPLLMTDQFALTSKERERSLQMRKQALLEKARSKYLEKEFGVPAAPAPGEGAPPGGAQPAPPPEGPKEVSPATPLPPSQDQPTLPPAKDPEVNEIK